MHKILMVVTAGLARMSGLAVLAGLALLAAPAAAEQVEFATRDTTLKAQLYRPAGTGPFPGIVALHDCEGLGAAGQPIDPHYADWAERLTKSGFAVLFPDSFGSRGLGSQCRVRERTVRASRLRTEDADAARHWLQGQPWIIADRISLLGWAHGGTTALWTIRRSSQERNKARGKSADFRSVVALYPSCRRSGASAWSARAPTLIIAGAADDWSPAALCQQMVAAARGRSAAVSLVVIPGAYQQFDRVNLPLQERTGMANTPNAAGRVHVGSHAAARNDVLRRVPEWFLR